MSSLAASDLVVGYTAEPVLRHVSVSVEAGEIVAILGPNGAGKTTLFKALAGLAEPRQGTVSLDGSALGRMRAEQRSRKGLILVPEGRRLFPQLTVLENLRAGRFTRRNGSTIEDVLRLFPRLAERTGTKAAQLSGGEQQMLAIGRALCGGPSVLLVDEPSLGLAPLIVETVFETFRGLADSGIAILIAEQNVAAATRVADRAVILDTGSIAFESACATAEQIEAVNRAYSAVIEIGA
jgi:branched-chain amino acid transport system ATP-binding protein